MRFSQLTIIVSLVVAVSAIPISKDDNQIRAAPFKLENGEKAQELNLNFQKLTASSPCTAGEEACVQGQLAQCIDGKFVLTPCTATLQCFALPLVNKLGTRYVPHLSEQ